jgi:glycosyltransferase involved in cell wall biosynthesis
LRILVLCNNNVRNLDVTTGPGEIIASFATELSRHHDVTLTDVRVKGLRLKLYKLLYRLRTGGKGSHERYSYLVYVARSRIAHGVTRQWAESVDLVFQMFWRYAPFVGRPLKPYVVYSDTTGRLSLRASEPNYDAKGAERIWRSERQVYQLAARIFAYNDRVRRSVVEDYGVDPEKVITAGVGVGLDPPLVGRVKRYDNRRLIFVGRDNAFEIKGVPTLLQAFKLVKERVEDAELVLVGISKERGIEQPGVTVLGRIADRQEVGRLLEDASLFVLASLRDESPGVIREAMIKKLPCVASAVDGIPEMVVDGETGRLVPPQDPERLAAVLIQLLQDQGELRRMGENGYRRALELFTWDKVVARMNEHLQRIVV